MPTDRKLTIEETFIQKEEEEEIEEIPIPKESIQKGLDSNTAKI